MSPPGPEPGQGWTLETLKEFFSVEIKALREQGNEREERNKERLKEVQNSIKVAMDAADKALTKGETGNERRFEGVNEWAKSFRELTSLYLSKAEYHAQFDALKDKVDGAITRFAKTEATEAGKHLGIGTIGAIVLGSAAILSLVVEVLRWLSQGQVH